MDAAEELHTTASSTSLPCSHSSDSTPSDSSSQDSQSPSPPPVDFPSWDDYWSYLSPASSSLEADDETPPSTPSHRPSANFTHHQPVADANTDTDPSVPYVKVLPPPQTIRLETYQYFIRMRRYAIYRRDPRYVWSSLEDRLRELGDLRTYGQRMQKRVEVAAKFEVIIGQIRQMVGRGENHGKRLQK